MFIGIRRAAVHLLPQASDNAANEHLGHARRVKIWMRFFLKSAGHNVLQGILAATFTYNAEHIHENKLAYKFS